MIANLNLLENDFRVKIENVIALCEIAGYILVPFFTLRNPWQQARLWRQSRTIGEINKAVAMLKDNDAEYLTEILLGVGPQYGLWATNALPGASWHQYGMACDCFVKENGEAVWNSKHFGYVIYATEAKRAGLTVISCECVHAQMFPREVLKTTNWKTINDIMLKKYGKIEKNINLI